MSKKKLAPKKFCKTHSLMYPVMRVQTVHKATTMLARLTVIIDVPVENDDMLYVLFMICK